jgi:hypothetical protein
MGGKSVRSASNVLISNGHPISEFEKTRVFRKDLVREDMQQNPIFPARTETFEQLVITARTYVQSTIFMSSSMLVMSLSCTRTALPILVENFHTHWICAESMKSLFRREASPINDLMMTLPTILRSTAIDVARRVITLLRARTPRIHMLGEAKAAQYEKERLFRTWWQVLQFE